MSYSETITRTDLANILNEVLPQSSYIQSWEYVGDVYWWGNTWTVPDDGFIEVYVEPSASNWYWRISDSKAPDTGWSHRLSGANALTVSQEFFVKKGAVLGTYDMNAISTAHVYYYKFTLKETIPEPAVDYIVEQGTSGIWTYRKWNSGVAECWGKHSFTITAWAQWGSAWETNGTYASYPTSLFISNPQLRCQNLVCSDGSATASLEMYQGASNTRTPSMYLMRHTIGNANVTGYIDIYAIGKWK